MLYMDGGAFEGVGSTDGETAAATTTEATEATDKNEITASTSTSTTSTSTASTSSTAFTSFKTVVEDLSHHHSSLATIQEDEEKSSEQGGGDKGGVIGSSISSSRDQKPKTEESGSCKLVKLKASFIANRSAWRDLKLAKEAEKKEEAEEKKENNSLRTPAEEEEKEKDHQPMPFFFTGQWRHLLCTCPSCLALYDWQQIPFITSLEDQTCYYEANSLKRVEEREEAAFASLPHVAKVELMQNLQGFQARLGQFFNRFAGTSEVVTKRHVEEFFEGEYRRREARKRQRTDGVPPSECGSAGR